MSRRIVIAVIGGLLAAGLTAGFSPATASSTRVTARETGSVWLAISAGHIHTCGIRRDHTLWCWGNNAYGQLGLGDTTDRSTPTQVGTEHRLGRGQSRRYAHLRNSHRPHPVVLGIQRLWSARARRHHEPEHPDQVGIGIDWTHVSRRR